MKLDATNQNRLKEFLKEAEDYKNKTFKERIFVKGFLERGALILSYCSLSMCQTYLTLNMIGQSFKRTDDAKVRTNNYNVYQYHKTFGMFNIMVFTAIPYFSTYVFNILINMVIKKLNLITTHDEQNQTSALSKFSRHTIFFGLFIQVWAFLVMNQQNPTGWLQFAGDGKDVFQTFNLMIVGLMLMGLSQSLITMGCHTYLIKAINVETNEYGEGTQDYPFTVNSI